MFNAMDFHGGELKWCRVVGHNCWRKGERVDRQQLIQPAWLDEQHPVCLWELLTGFLIVERSWSATTWECRLPVRQQHWNTVCATIWTASRESSDSTSYAKLGGKLAESDTGWQLESDTEWQYDKQLKRFNCHTKILTVQRTIISEFRLTNCHPISES